PGRNGKPMATPCHHLLLVRHSTPEIALGVPARDWRLSAEGRARAHLLAERLTAYSPALLASSDEPKAIETASILGQRLGLSSEIVPDLREHERPNAPLLDAAAFQAAIARFFAHPEAIVFGAESAAQALARFSHAVSGLIARAPAGDTLLVTHGTVLALFVAAVTAKSGKNGNARPRSGEGDRSGAHALWRVLG